MILFFCPPFPLVAHHVVSPNLASMVMGSAARADLVKVIDAHAQARRMTYAPWIDCWGKAGNRKLTSL